MNFLKYACHCFHQEGALLIYSAAETSHEFIRTVLQGLLLSKDQTFNPVSISFPGPCPCQCQFLNDAMNIYDRTKWQLYIMSIHKAQKNTRSRGNLGISHEREWTKSAKNRSTLPLRDTYRLTPLSAKATSPDSLFN